MTLLMVRDAIVWCLGVLVVTLACGESNPVSPLEEGWSALELDEGFVIDLELAWPYLFAGTGEDGLFRATVSASEPEWKSLGFVGEQCGMVKVLKDGTVLVTSSKLVDPSVPLYSIGLYRSEDLGRTWTLSDSGSAGGFGCLASCCEALIGIRGVGEVCKSVDGGLSWRTLSSIGFTGWSQIACHPKDCSFLLATPDWGRMSPLLVSHDGGSTWSKATYSCPNGCSDPRGIAMDPKEKEVAYVGTRGAVLRTSDAGATWTPIIEPAETPWFRAIALDPNRPDHVYAGGEGYVYLTPDAGNTVEVIEAPDETQVLDLKCVANRDILFIATLTGVYRYVF
jgi:hypothetical protein